MRPSRELSRKALGAATDDSPFEHLELSLAQGLLGVALTLPMLAFLLWFLRTGWAPLRGIRDALDATFVPLFRHCTWDEILALACAAGVGEELLFRAWMQASLAEWLGAYPALAIAAVAFGVVHAVTRAYAVLATAIGVYLGLAFLFTGNVFAPLVAHVVYDAVALFVILRRAPRDDVPRARPPDVEESGESRPR